MPNLHPVRRSTRNAREGKILVGCLTALGIVLVLAISATVLIVMNWQRIVGKGIGVMVEAGVNQLPISATEQAEVNAVLHDTIARYSKKEITFEQLARATEATMNSPAVQGGLISDAAAKYLQGTTLGDDERAAGEQQLRPLAMGLLTKQIDHRRLEEILDPIRADDDTDDAITLGINISGTGKDEFRIRTPSSVSPEAIQQVIDSAQASADEAGIEEQPPVIDLSDEIRKAIDGVLNPSSTTKDNAGPDADAPEPDEEP